MEVNYFQISLIDVTFHHVQKLVLIVLVKKYEKYTTMRQY